VIGGDVAQLFILHFGSLQVETVLTVALVMLSLCGMVRDSTSHASCSIPSPAQLGYVACVQRATRRYVEYAAH
jgi:hypothetical protein